MEQKCFGVFLGLVISVAGLGSVHAADWAVDFDSPLPANWVSGETTYPTVGEDSATFAATVADGILRISDANSAAVGGSFSGFAGTTDVFTDVIVGIDVNVVPDSDDDLGVVARADLVAGTGYFASVDYELGEACITKVMDHHTGIDIACSADGSLSTSSAYRLEFIATGSSTTNLTLSVKDLDGNLIQTVAATDDGGIEGFGAAYEAGVSGAFLVPIGTTLNDAAANAINGTFDNAFSQTVPEPSASLLLVFGVAGAMGWRRRRS